MKVKISVCLQREVEIPNSCVKYDGFSYCLTEKAYNKYMGEHSPFLKPNEECVCGIYTMDNEIVAEW